MSRNSSKEKYKENDFSMEFSASSKSREIDRSEGFYRIMSMFGAAFDATSPLSSRSWAFRGPSNVLVLRLPIR